MLPRPHPASADTRKVGSETGIVEKPPLRVIRQDVRINEPGHAEDLAKKTQSLPQR